MATVVHFNGSKFAGQSPDPVSELLRRLRENVLDPRFEGYGNFAIAGDPAIAAGHTRFWGNFYDVSAAFSVETDDAALIKELTAAIRANQGTAAYLRARRECQA